MCNYRVLISECATRGTILAWYFYPQKVWFLKVSQLLQLNAFDSIAGHTAIREAIEVVGNIVIAGRNLLEQSLRKELFSSCRKTECC